MPASKYMSLKQKPFCAMNSLRSRNETCRDGEGEKDENISKDYFLTNLGAPAMECRSRKAYFLQEVTFEKTS